MNRLAQSLVYTMALTTLTSCKIRQATLSTPHEADVESPCTGSLEDLDDTPAGTSCADDPTCAAAVDNADWASLAGDQSLNLAGAGTVTAADIDKIIGNLDWLLGLSLLTPATMRMAPSALAPFRLVPLDDDGTPTRNLRVDDVVGATLPLLVHALDDLPGADANGKVAAAARVLEQLVNSARAGQAEGDDLLRVFDADKLTQAIRSGRVSVTKVLDTLPGATFGEKASSIQRLWSNIGGRDRREKFRTIRDHVQSLRYWIDRAGAGIGSGTAGMTLPDTDTRRSLATVVTAMAGEDGRLTYEDMEPIADGLFQGQNYQFTLGQIKRRAAATMGPGAQVLMLNALDNNAFGIVDTIRKQIREQARAFGRDLFVTKLKQTCACGGYPRIRLYDVRPLYEYLRLANYNGGAQPAVSATDPATTVQEQDLLRKLALPRGIPVNKLVGTFVNLTVPVDLKISGDPSRIVIE